MCPNRPSEISFQTKWVIFGHDRMPYITYLPCLFHCGVNVEYQNNIFSKEAKSIRLIKSTDEWPQGKADDL